MISRRLTRIFSPVTFLSVCLMLVGCLLCDTAYAQKPKKKNLNKSVKRSQKNVKAPEYPPFKEEIVPTQFSSGPEKKKGGSKVSIKEKKPSPSPSTKNRKRIMKKGSGNPLLHGRSRNRVKDKRFVNNTPSQRRKKQRKLIRKRSRSGTLIKYEPNKGIPNVEKHQPRKKRSESPADKKKRYRKAVQRNIHGGLSLGRKKSSKTIAIEAITRANEHNSKTRGINITERNSRTREFSRKMHKVGARKGKQKKPSQANMATPKGSQLVRVYKPGKGNRHPNMATPAGSQLVRVHKPGQAKLAKSERKPREAKSFPNSFVAISKSRKERREIKLSRARQLGGFRIKMVTAKDKKKAYAELAHARANTKKSPGAFKTKSLAQKRSLNASLAKSRQFGAPKKAYARMKTSRISQWWDELWGSPDKQQRKVKRKKSSYDSKEHKIWYD